MYHLLNRTWDHGGFNWWGAESTLGKYKAVCGINYMDTMSSAGDWSGLVVLKHNNRYCVTVFSQENRYPYRGFRQHTGGIVARFDTMPDDDNMDEVWNYLIS